MNSSRQIGNVVLTVLLAGCSSVRTAEPPVRLADGRAVYDQVCSTCHSLNPPPGKAPPMTHVAQHYLDAAAGDSAAAVRRVERWLLAPAESTAVLPPHAVQRWGLMPPLSLTARQRAAAALFVVSLAGAGAHPH